MIGKRDFTTAAVIVAHPDDETIWAGGAILMHPDWQWTVISLCRGSDLDRAPKFKRVLQKLGVGGQIGDLDDGLQQRPLPLSEVRQTVLSLLTETHFDLIMTHSPFGEYTRHLRHEETSQAIASLWETGDLSAAELQMFAYEDGGKSYLPQPIKTAHRSIILPENIWQQKYRIVTEFYGFGPESYEARIVQRKEAFWRFRSSAEFQEWLNKEKGEVLESTDSV